MRLFLCGKIVYPKKTDGDTMNEIRSFKTTKDELKNIRAIELRFDKIVRNDSSYTLIQDDIVIGSVTRKSLTDKTVILLDSLAGMERHDYGHE